MAGIALLFGCVFLIRAHLPASIRHVVFVLIGALASLAVSFEAWRQEWANANANGLLIPLRGISKLLRSDYTIKAEDLLRPYLGRRYSLSGTVKHLCRDFVWLESDGIKVLLFFPIRTPADVMNLHSGQGIEVSGRFVSFDAENCATFRCCKLVTVYWPAIAA